MCGFHAVFYRFETSEFMLIKINWVHHLPLNDKRTSDVQFSKSTKGIHPSSKYISTRSYMYVRLTPTKVSLDNSIWSSFIVGRILWAEQPLIYKLPSPWQKWTCLIIYVCCDNEVANQSFDLSNYLVLWMKFTTTTRDYIQLCWYIHPRHFGSYNMSS